MFGISMLLFSEAVQRENVFIIEKNLFKYYFFLEFFKRRYLKNYLAFGKKLFRFLFKEK